jgi:hypothetical protein
LSGLFGYLVAAGYLAGNPLALRRQRHGATPRRRGAVERYLSQSVWAFVLETIDRMPKPRLASAGTSSVRVGLCGSCTVPRCARPKQPTPARATSFSV